MSALFTPRSNKPVHLHIQPFGLSRLFAFVGQDLDEFGEWIRVR
jgi:hypothetical protein